MNFLKFHNKNSLPLYYKIHKARRWPVVAAAAEAAQLMSSFGVAN